MRQRKKKGKTRTNMWDYKDNMKETEEEKGSKYGRMRGRRRKKRGQKDKYGRRKKDVA